jgi:RNA polymerase sigma factor (sigma-70 family)
MHCRPSRPGSRRHEEERFMTSLSNLPATATRQPSVDFEREQPKAGEHIDGNALLAFVETNFGHFLRRKCNAICAGHGLGRHDAEDLCSNTLCQIGVKVHTRRPPLDKVDEWKSYLSRIAKHLVLNARRAAARRAVRDEKYGVERELRQQTLASKSPELNLMTEEIRRILAESCDARTQSVFRRWSEGWSRGQIAVEMNVCKSTVNRALKRALAIIRPKLQSGGW